MTKTATLSGRHDKIEVCMEAKVTSRLVVLDWLRGLTLIAMAAYHTMWDLVYIFRVDIPWYRTNAGFLWQQSICWTFILLSGFCFRLGKHPAKRGLLILAAPGVISMVSIVFMPQSAIRFGVLTLMGSCMLLLIPLDRLLKTLNPYIGLLISFLLFGITRYVPRGSLGFFSWELAELPHWVYRNLLTAWAGFPAADFASSDYFPLIPWLFLYLCGYFLWGIFQRNHWFLHLQKPSIPALEWIGRNSLLLYMLHQPVIYGVLLLIF